MISSHSKHVENYFKSLRYVVFFFRINFVLNALTKKTFYLMPNTT